MYCVDLKIVRCIIHAIEMVIVMIIRMDHGRVFANFGGKEHCVMNVSYKLK